MDIMRHHAASSHPTSTKATLNLSCQHNRIHASYSRASPAHRAQHTLPSIPSIHMQHTKHSPTRISSILSIRRTPTASSTPYAAFPMKHSLCSILYAACSSIPYLVYPALRAINDATYPTWHIQHTRNTQDTLHILWSTRCDISQCSCSRFMLLGGSCSRSYTLYYALL